MSGNFLKLAFRNLLKNKVYSFINIFGLSIGIAACILIMMWVVDELNFNTFNENLDDIYLVPQTQHYKTIGDFTVPVTPSALAPAIKEEIPEIKNATRYSSFLGESLVKYNDKSFSERVDAADPAFFKIFTFPFLKGNPKTALTNPYTIVMDEDMSHKYFGNEDPLNKTITIDGYNFLVTGIFKNIPHNSDIRPQMVIGFNSLREIGMNVENWGNNSLFTYIQLQKNIPYKTITEKIKGRIQREIDASTAGTLFLFPFKDLHLYSVRGNGGRIESVIMFSIIAGFILLIACINFMNLTTARSAKRAREVGIKKVVGATRAQIARQFFGESFFLAFLALGIALILADLVLPLFNQLSGKELSLGSMGITAGILVLVLTLLTGIISGIYPALLLSSFRPVTILKESIRSGRGSFNLRKVLVVFQFVISVGLIICTIVVSRQLDFLQNKELGLQKDNILYFSLNNNTSPNIDAMKNELQKSPDVLSVSYTSHLPIQVYSNGGGWEWEGKDPSQDELVTSLYTDKDFLKTFGVKLEEGRFFSDEYPSDTSNTVVINRTFADMISHGQVAGKILTRGEQNYNIVGVVQNFDFLGSRREAGPIAIRLTTEPRFASIKLNGKNTNAAVDYITKVYKEFDPNYPFEYHFLDSTFEEMFKSERRLGDIFNSFAILAIIISCLGLFGLSTFIAEQKTKEIGIRKVLGATVLNVVTNLTKEFLKWVIIANIVAWPLAYYFMTNWLKDYPYKISLGWDIFVISGIAALLIAVITISFQSIKAALSDPAKSLRYE